MTPQTQARNITKFLAMIHPAGQLFELRALWPDDRHPTVGVFDDPAEAAKYAVKLDQMGASVFYTLNAVKASSKPGQGKWNSMDHNARIAARDADMDRRNAYLIDVDPSRPSGVCATDEEKAAAKEVADNVTEYLSGLGWPGPMVVDSGNGFHLLYRGSGCSADGRILKFALKQIAKLFDLEAAHVDISVFNAARIARLPYTHNRKGTNTADRPHRLARVVSAELWEPLLPVRVLRLAEAGGYVSQFDEPADTGHSSRKLLVDANGVRKIIATYPEQLQIARETTEGDTVYFALASCPFKGAAHRGQMVGRGKTTIIARPDGVGYSCFSDDCADHTFVALVRMLERETAIPCPVQLFAEEPMDLDAFNGDLCFNTRVIPGGVHDGCDGMGVEAPFVLEMFRSSVLQRMAEEALDPKRWFAVGRMMREVNRVIRESDVETAADFLGAERVASLRRWCHTHDGLRYMQFTVQKRMDARAIELMGGPVITVQPVSSRDIERLLMGYLAKEEAA